MYPAHHETQSLMDDRSLSDRASEVDTNVSFEHRLPCIRLPKWLHLALSSFVKSPLYSNAIHVAKFQAAGSIPLRLKPTLTKSWAIAKRTAQCTLYMAALKIFESPWVRPWQFFPRF